MKKIQSFLQIFEDDLDGEPAGSLELLKIDLKTARAYATKELAKIGRNIDQELPNFNANFLFCQNAAKGGWMQRRNMPVIKTKNIKELQQRLADGYIDVNKPWSDVHGQPNPFPTGLSGATAKLWLKGGLKKYDGKTKDDLVNTQLVRVSLKDLHPIQSQIYFDKAIESLVQRGSAGFLSKLATSIFVLGENLEIIDGHHRFLAGGLINPNSVIRGLVVNLPLGTLLPMSVSYSSAIGNKANS